MRQDNTLRPNVFIPHPYQELSVTRHRDASEEELWTAAFADYDLTAWMLCQRRGARSWTPPGHRPLKWWQIAVLIGLPPLIGVAWWRERRRRKKLARASIT